MLDAKAMLGGGIGGGMIRERLGRYSSILRKIYRKEI